MEETRAMMPSEEIVLNIAKMMQKVCGGSTWRVIEVGTEPITFGGNA
jgi:hypothetical protein